VEQKLYTLYNGWECNKTKHSAAAFRVGGQ